MAYYRYIAETRSGRGLPQLWVTLGLLLAVFAAQPAMGALVINEVMSCNTLTKYDSNEEYPDWIELYNTGPDDINIAGWGLSDDPNNPFKFVCPSRTITAGARRLIYASGTLSYSYEIHSNFKIDSDGETLTLVDPEGQMADSLFTGYMPADVSRGRIPDGEDAWYFFAEATPGNLNTTTGYRGLAAAPNITVPGGNYEGAFAVEIHSPSPLAEIRYTTDAVDPTDQSSLYAGAIAVDMTSILRARCFEDSLVPSAVTTATYLFGESRSLPIVSLVTDPRNLWDEEIGIYILGDDYNPEWPHYGANFWKPWERPASMELFESDGSTGIDQNIGIRIHGGYSRAQAQKSLRLIARRGYGQETFDYQVFPEKAIDGFRYLVLRNSGNDWCYTQMRDGFAHRLTEGEDLGVQGYRPAVIFINGEYWGVQNIRERMNDDYLHDNYGVDPEEVDLIKEYDFVMAGDDVHYEAMIDFVETNGLASEANYEYIQTQMDVENFTTYFLYEVFWGNLDWPHGNIKYWRPRTPGGRWQWLLYDVDFGFALYPQYGDYTHDTLHFVIRDDGPVPPRANLLLRALLENDDYRRDFINRYAALMSGQLTATRMSTILQQTAGEIAGEMPGHMTRWGYDMARWEAEFARVEEYVELRGDYAQTHVMQQFSLPDTLLLSVAVEPLHAGKLEFAGLSIDSAWSGVFFRGNPIPLQAVPGSGYLFDGWSEPGLPDSSSVVISPDGAMQLTARFTEGGPVSPIIVINEINYNSSPTFDTGDWVELHNPGDAALDLAGWRFLDSEDSHVFTLAAGVVVPPGGFIVLCEDRDDFLALFPETEAVFGDLGFGFSGSGELLRVQNPEGELIDAVVYGDSPPWPTEPDGYGPTLELIDPRSDNSLPGAWAASQGNGTPGATNSVYLTGLAPLPSPVLQLGAPHPNPFNPRTVVPFTLPNSGPVRLSAHDPRGRLVAMLIDARLPGGRHEIVWDAGNLPSGVYLLRLEAAGEIRVAKTLLLK